MDGGYMNEKGFTMVELLAVIAIIGILSGLGIEAYSRYITSTRNKALDILAESSKNAAEEYFMDNQNDTSINIDELAQEGYLDSIKDPKDNKKTCSGTVRKISSASSDPDALEAAEYNVSLCCTDYNYTYSFPAKTKKKDRDGCKADFNTADW